MASMQSIREVKATLVSGINLAPKYLWYGTGSTKPVGWLLS